MNRAGDCGMEPGDDTIPAHFQRQAVRYPDQRAIGSGSWRCTYAELDAVANCLAHNVITCGGVRGDRIAVLLRHDSPLIAAVLAVLKAGRTVVVLNPTDPPARLVQVLEDADTRLIVTESQHRPLAEQIARKETVHCLGDLFPGPAVPPPKVGVAPDDLAFLVYTSGSTGRPKAVMQTHRNIVHNVCIRLCRRLGLRPDDRVPLLASLSGGNGMGTTWFALLNGATLCPFPIVEKGVTGLADWMRTEGITVYVSAASVFRHFMRTLADDERLSQVRWVRLASEPATDEDVALFRKHFSADCILFHTLASSETGNSCQFQLTAADTVASGRLPIGRPATDVSILLLDEEGREVAPGQAGEIVIQSAYLSPGYWRNEALTAERFSGTGAARVFRSGDLGRRTSDGLLVFAGRKDDRVKVRGYRIETSEIEDALVRLPGVERAVVGTRTRSDNELQLVAYIVPRSGASTSAAMLRRGLRALLPAHMIPAGFVILDTFPLTPHGKIDREKLRQMPLPVRDSEATARPETETEVLLAGIWAEAFGREGIGRDDEFFDLGGDSLTAAVVAARVYAAKGVELQLGAFAEHPTLAGLAAVIDARNQARSQNPRDRLARVSRQRPLPLSFMQERTWQFSRTPEASRGYHVSNTYRLRGPLDVPLLRQNIDYLIGRHEILRTTFAEVNGRPVQTAHGPRPVEIPYFDLSGTGDAEERARLQLRNEARRPFDLARLPLLRFALVRIREDEHWLFRVIHHIISDNWSWQVLLRELTLLYEAGLRGEQPPLPAYEPLQYADYAVWQRRVLRPDGAGYREAMTWWKNLLAGPLPPLHLPCRRPEPVADTDPSKGVVRSGLDRSVVTRLDQLGRETGATFFMVRVAAFVALLAQETGQEDIVLGTYCSNRNRKEFQHMFGYFANLVTLRFRCNPAISFRAWLARVRRTVSEMHAHSDMPYEHLSAELCKEGRPPPEIRAIFSVTDQPGGRYLGPVEFMPLERQVDRMPWGFSLNCDPRNEQYPLRALFDANLYDPAGVRELLSRYARLLAAASCNADQQLQQLLTVGQSFPSQAAA